MSYLKQKTKNLLSHTQNYESNLINIFLLCIPANCYKRVMEETQQMQKKIEEKLGLSPDEKEVVVLYDGERDKVFNSNKTTKFTNQFVMSF